VLTSLAVFLENISDSVQNPTLDPYPGNLSVLFIEYTKCLPKDVNRRGR